jgi:hypothetical protein
VKISKLEDLDFWLCNLGLRTVKRGCSVKSWGEIISALSTFLHSLFILCNLLERSTQESMLLKIFWAETSARKIGYSSGKHRRLGPEPETPTENPANPTWFVDQVVHVPVVGLGAF